MRGVPNKVPDGWVSCRVAAGILGITARALQARVGHHFHPSRCNLMVAPPIPKTKLLHYSFRIFERKSVEEFAQWYAEQARQEFTHKLATRVLTNTRQAYEVDGKTRHPRRKKTKEDFSI